VPVVPVVAVDVVPEVQEQQKVPQSHPYLHLNQRLQVLQEQQPLQLLTPRPQQLLRPLERRKVPESHHQLQPVVPVD
jgi:hypothetical protein